MSAVISPCGTYRYLLRREWLGGDGILCFVMLNPSTADASEDDPTIRRCIGFAKAWRYTALEVVNLFAFRAPKPARLFTSQGDIVGPENDAHLAEATTRASMVVVAWGAIATLRRDRVAAARALIRRDTYALGLTNAGEPRHPLYVRGDAVPVRWPA